MAKIDYGQAEVHVIACDKGIRQSLKTVLFSKGFRNVRISEDLDLLVDAINLKDLPNLLIVDVDIPDQDTCELISAIRNKRMGNDPYLPVMGMAWNPEQELITKIINTGFDFLIAKPFSANQISSRIDKLIHERQPFIVTGDYLGPDRYKDPSRVSKIPNFQVPNALKSAAVDGLRKAEHWRKIGDMNDVINQQRLNQLATEIDRIIDLVTPELDSKNVTENTVKNLDQLLDHLKHTRFHIIKKEHKEVSNLCVEFYRTVKSLLSVDGDINAGDVRKLRPLSDAVTTGLCGSKENLTSAKQNTTPPVEQQIA